MGLPYVDLFASKSNAKVPVYSSLEREVGAKRIDAYAKKWVFYLYCAFPPFKRILLVLRKFAQERTTMILVILYWPKRHWFSISGN